uniref:DH domain-containing protein n=1 Tax=Romanomermis culicivorax TaxID=13658 RepID=A0A915HVK1_ROMCU
MPTARGWPQFLLQDILRNHRCERFLSANSRNGRQPFFLTTVSRTNQQQGQKISNSCGITTSNTNQNLSATSAVNTTKNRRRQKPAKKISWTILLNKMYEQALVKQQNFGDNEDRCATGIENGHTGDDGTKTVVAACTPNPYSTVKDGSGATVFVTTSSQTNTTTTVTSCGSVIKTTSQQMSAKVVKVKNSNLTATAPVNSASSCKDLLKFLPGGNGHPFLDRTGRGSRSSSSIIIPTPNGVAQEVTGRSAPDGQIIFVSSPVSPEKMNNFIGGSLDTWNREGTNAGQKEEELIDETLNKTLVTFGSLLQKEREKFMDMFPQFVNERTKPRITTETIVQPDGTILVIEKEESRHILQLSRRTTFINGKVHLRTTKAVMVYGGAENGYELKLEEADDDEPAVQESENEDNDEESDLWSNSEFGDTESVQFHLEKPAAINNHRFLLKAENETKKCKKKLDNAFSAAQELVETERRYISKLHLLNKTFRQKVEELNDKSILGEKMCRLFSNVATLFIFHNDHLLPQLENRLKEW